VEEEEEGEEMNDLMKLALLLIVAPTCWHDLMMMGDMR
jgi:hypothetical protein